MPFGGFKESGIGRELGEAALDNYCNFLNAPAATRLVLTLISRPDEDRLHQTRRRAVRLSGKWAGLYCFLRVTTYEATNAMYNEQLAGLHLHVPSKQSTT